MNSQTCELVNYLCPVRITAFILLAVLFFSCRKESFTGNPDAQLTVHTDTVHFDTVFTTAGSVTKFFKVFNNNSNAIRIDSIALKGAEASPFLVNINGSAGPRVIGLNLAAHDSAYVFVTVRVNPSTSRLPFVVRDSIAISYNGKSEVVQLKAYGQNAHFIRNKVITGSEVWHNDLPYVILNDLEIAPSAHLTIEKGCKVYVHASATILVKGTLKAEGTETERILFTGNRLDEPYNLYPAGWPGIIFAKDSKDNQLSFATINNAYQGIVVAEPSSNSHPKLVLNETIIDNAYDAGLLTINSSVTARNLLISNCGSNLVLQGGGNYQFTHCTIAAFYNGFITHKQPVLQVQNFFQQNGITFSNQLNAVFRNCIFWGEGGSVDDEVVVSKQGEGPFSVLFDHVLWKVKNPPANATIESAINDLSPEFETIDPVHHIFSFRLKETSPALGQGTRSNVTADLDGKQRPAASPDLGAYQSQ